MRVKPRKLLRGGIAAAVTAAVVMSLLAAAAMAKEQTFRGLPVPSYDFLLDGGWISSAQLQKIRLTPEGRAYLRHVLRPLPRTLRRGMYLDRPVAVTGTNRPPPNLEPSGGRTPLLLVAVLVIAAAAAINLAGRRLRLRPERSLRTAKRRR